MPTVYKDADNNNFEFLDSGAVKMNGKVVGEIRAGERGYQYFPKGQKYGGDTFLTVCACQNDILGL